MTGGEVPQRAYIVAEFVGELVRSPSAVLMMRFIFFAVSVMSFIWLLNLIVFNEDLLPDLADALSFGIWMAIIFPILIISLGCQIGLFFFQRTRVPF